MCLRDNIYSSINSFSSLSSKPLWQRTFVQFHCKSFAQALNFYRFHYTFQSPTGLSRFVWISIAKSFPVRRHLLLCIPQPQLSRLSSAPRDDNISMKQSFLLRSLVNSLVSPSCSSPMQSIISHLVGQCRALKNHDVLTFYKYASGMP